MTKKCIKCQNIKELVCFVSDKKRKDGTRNECRECRQHSQKQGPTKNNHLKRTYGITLNQYNEMLTIQNHCCLICKRHTSELKHALHTDHCHATLKVRGLLCFNCNQGLGNFKDSMGLLISAFEYLKAKT